ncbi:MAG: division/cell wall cluster transcriptional repressor MraZ, partial [Angustibacter sp.]
EVTQRARSAPMTNRAARDYLRVFLSGASDEIPDKQGRITLPPHLRQYANLTKELTIVGAGSRLEIWAASAWDAYLDAQEQAFSEQDEEVIPGLF